MKYIKLFSLQLYLKNRTKPYIYKIAFDNDRFTSIHKQFVLFINLSKISVKVGPEIDVL